MPHDFSGQAFLVTGSTRGIGKAIASTIAQAGGSVAIHGRDLGKVQSVCDEIDPAQAKAFAADLSDPQNAGDLVKNVFNHFGRLDGLVNNAGGGRAVAFRGLKLEDWRATQALNLESAFIASKEAYKLMRKAKAGSIVNMASLAAHGPGNLMGADYAASKAGLVSLTRSLALEAARFGIRCNAISPGIVETDMAEGMTDEMIAKMAIPLNRLASCDDVAKATAFLLSSDSQYMTGQILHVDGGQFIYG